jgi:hypothetical protein
MLYSTKLPDNVGRNDVCPSTLLDIHDTPSVFYRLNYTWINQDRKSVNLPAPTYIDYVMTWVQNLLDDDTTFPTKAGEPRLWFPILGVDVRDLS